MKLLNKTLMLLASTATAITLLSQPAEASYSNTQVRATCEWQAADSPVVYQSCRVIRITLGGFATYFINWADGESTMVRGWMRSDVLRMESGRPVAFHKTYLHGLALPQRLVIKDLGTITINYDLNY